MIGLRNPFAIRNGKVILIEDLTANERGLNCQCRCPACNGDFIARMGDIKIHHFAHSKDACDEIIAYTSGLYKLIQQILGDGTPFYIPELAISFYMPPHQLLNESSIESFVNIIGKNRNSHNSYNKKVVSKGKSVSFENICLAYDSKNHIQAIELTCMNRKMAIKIMPPSTVCKFASVSPHKNMATLVLDFTDDSDRIQNSNSENFRKYLFSKAPKKYWISNPLIKKIYPELLELNKKAYDEYIEKQKQLEAEREAALKQQRALAEKKRLLALERQKRREEIRKIAEQKKISENKAKDILACESVKDKFMQQTEQIKDCYGRRWIKCEICGEIKKEPEFWTYGGLNRVNLGQCYSCCGK